MENLHGKCVILGISAGIAAYKMAYLTSMLKKAGAEVHVIMTKNATQFICPLTFETLSARRCIVDMFDRAHTNDVEHVALAKKADLIMVGPATADIIAKIAHGIADDMLTTVILAAQCPKLIAPSMNSAMLENPATRDNLARLGALGFEVIEPASGMLACNEIGAGRLPEPQELFQYIEHSLARNKSLQGVRVLVSAGPTQEALDPVRFLTNHSSGKMGYALAREAMLRGADVTLISGPVAQDPVPFVKTIRITSAQDMFEGVRQELASTDILIMAAAVADWRPAQLHADKIKKDSEELTIRFKRTEDILRWVCAHRHPGLFVCGFSMETHDLLAASREKLLKKSLDMIVANDLTTPGAGFACSTNVASILTKDSVTNLDLMSKEELAVHILDAIEALRGSNS